MAHRKYVAIEDFRKAAGKRLPKIFADYVEGGSFSETTLRRNVEAFSRYALSQRVLTGLSEPDLSTQYLGRRQALPFFPGPVGFLGLYRRDGDLHVGLSAKQHGVPFVLSSFSIRGIRSLAPLWRRGQKGAGLVRGHGLLLGRRGLHKRTVVLYRRHTKRTPVR